MYLLPVIRAQLLQRLDPSHVLALRRNRTAYVADSGKSELVSSDVIGLIPSYSFAEGRTSSSPLVVGLSFDYCKLNIIGSSMYPRRRRCLLLAAP
jgi:hypothetical protein